MYSIPESGFDSGGLRPKHHPEAGSTWELNPQDVPSQSNILLFS